MAAWTSDPTPSQSASGAGPPLQELACLLCESGYSPLRHEVYVHCTIQAAETHGHGWSRALPACTATL